MTWCSKEVSRSSWWAYHDELLIPRIVIIIYNLNPTEILTCFCCLRCVHEATAHALSAEEAESRSIHDIVMPLPGYDVIYPSHHGKAFLEMNVHLFSLDVKHTHTHHHTKVRAAK